jgi:hypothetical protein
VLAVTDEPPEAGVARPSPGETVPFEGADREAEKTRRSFLIEKGIHFRVLPPSVGRTKTGQICWEGLANFAVTIPANSTFGLVSALKTKIRELFSSQDRPDEVVSAGVRKLRHELLLRLP